MKVYNAGRGRGRMLLLTAENLKALPPLKATEGQPDPLIRVKFFDPCGSWTWYALEFDGVDLFYGLVDGHEKELGYFSLSELASIKRPFYLGIERDRHFTPTVLSRFYTPRPVLVSYVVSCIDRAGVRSTRTLDATSTAEAMTMLERAGVDYVEAEVCDASGAQLAVYDEPSANAEVSVNGWRVLPTPKGSAE